MSEAIPENPSPTAAASAESKAAWGKAKSKDEGAPAAAALASTAAAAPATATAASAVVVEASWPSLGDAKKAEVKPRSASPRKKSEEESKDTKDTKGKGKWVPFPEPVPVAPREEASSHEGHHHREHREHRGDTSRRGGSRRGGGRGGANGGGRGAHHGSSGHYHRRGPHAHSAGPDAAGPTGPSAPGAPATSTTSAAATTSSGAEGGSQSLNYNAPSFQPYGYSQPYPDYTYYYYETLYMVQQQVEYYFSDENLAKDAFLRSQLSPEGWIPIETIASFRRLATLLANMVPPENYNFIAMALQNSVLVEFSNGLLRRRVSPPLSSDAPVFVPSSATAASANAGAAGASAVAPASDAAPAPSAAPLKGSPATARSPAVTGASGRHRASSAPRSPTLRPNTEGDWTEVAPTKRTNGKSTKSVHTARKQQPEEAGDEEMEFMFDEETATRPGAKAPVKHSAHLDDVDSDEEDEEELPDEEFENIVVIVQTPDSRGKKSEARDRTGVQSLKAKSEFAGHIHDELNDFNEGIEHSQRSGSFSKTSVVSRAEFEAQRAASGMSPTALLQQAAPKLPTTLGSSPLSGVSKSPSKAIPMGRSPAQSGSLARSPASGSLARSPANGIAAGDGQKKFFPTPVKEPAAKKTPYKSKYGSNPVAESGVGWIKMRPPRASPAPIALAASLDPANGTPKARQIATDLISSQGLVEQKYRKFLNECLADREATGPGKSDLMSALFRFWSFFLRNNFNRSVYEEFKKLARADSAAGFSYGMECLYRFYSYGLEKSFRRGPFEDFQQFVLEDFKTGNLYGLEKFWAFLKYRKDKRPVKYTDELEAILKSFDSLEDFHSFGSRACNPAPGAAAGAAAAVPATAPAATSSQK